MQNNCANSPLNRKVKREPCHWVDTHAGEWMIHVEYQRAVSQTTEQLLILPFYSRLSFHFQWKYSEADHPLYLETIVYLTMKAYGLTLLTI